MLYSTQYHNVLSNSHDNKDLQFVSALNNNVPRSVQHVSTEAGAIVLEKSVLAKKGFTEETSPLIGQQIFGQLRRNISLPTRPTLVPYSSLLSQ